MHANTEKLRKIMRKYKMTSTQVAGITNRTVNTVHVWRCKHPARVIPAELLKLVELSAIASQQGRKA
ncbi:hypothetical protein D3C87_475770 [compost metagenome]